MRFTIFLIVAVMAYLPCSWAAAPVAGGPGKAIWFDSQRNDIMGIRWDNPSLTALTVEFWMAVMDTHLRTETVLALAEYDASEDPIYDNADGMQIRFRDSRTCYYRTACDAACKTGTCQVLGSSTWMHFAMTWNSSTGVSTFYKNGAQVYTLAGSGRYALPLTSNGCFIMGHEPDEFCGKFDETQAFDGLIDEFRVWDHVRTGAEIAANYRTSVDVSSPGLNIYYNFDAGTSTVPDLSSNGNVGLLGRLPDLRQVMTYTTTRGTVLPTSPVTLASRAPLVGSAAVLAYAVVGTEITIELLAFDADTATLSATLLTAPTKGTLNQFGTSTPISASDTIVDTQAQSKRVLYTATTLSGGADVDTFTYRVSDGVNTADAAVEVRLMTISSAPSKTLRFVEDERGVAVLGGVNVDGVQLNTVITELPANGTLYQVSFGGSSPGYYDQIPTDASLMTPITSIGTVLNNPRGVVVFFPDADTSAEDVYTTFTYAWQHPSYPSVQSADATATVYVASVDDAPDGQAANITITDEDTQLIQLTAVDNDVNFSPRLFYQVSSFPKLGRLYQVNDSTDITTEALVEKNQPPTVIAFASAVLNASTQYSRCEANGCFTWDTCPGACPSGVSDYHAVQILGKPDFYPAVGDSPLTWSFSTADSAGEFIVVQFPDPVYISGIEVYETQAPGSVVRIATSSDYDEASGDATWQTLWSGEVQTVPEVARVFQPPMCPYGFASDKVRLDMDSVARAGWNEFDAVKLIGTLDLPRGTVRNAQGYVGYEPPVGVHSADDSGLLDEFTYTSSDCEAVSAPTTVRIYRPAPVVTQDSVPSHWKVFSSTAPLESDATVTVPLSDVVADLISHGVTVSGSDIDDATLRVETAQVGGSVKAGDLDLLVNGASVSLPFTLPSGVTSFTMRARPKQGRTRFHAWITISGFTYRTQLLVEQACSKTYHPLSSTGVCIPCQQIPSSQIAAMSPAERVLFREACPQQVEVSSGLRSGLSAIAAGGVVITLAALYGVYKYREHPVIRYSSPVFCYIILLGCLLGVSSVFLLSAEPTNGVCAAVPWFLHGAFVMVFANLFAKTFRLAVVFNNDQLKNIKITNAHLFFKVVAAFAAPTLAYLSIWTAIDPPTVSLATHGQQQWYTCSSSTPLWWAMLVAVEAVILGWGVYLCVKTRNNPTAFNESKYIASSIYNLVVTGVLIFPLLLLLTPSPDTQLLLKSVGVLLVTFAVVGLLFIPKFHAIYYKDSTAWDTTTTGSLNANPGASVKHSGLRAPEVSKQPGSGSHSRKASHGLKPIDIAIMMPAAMAEERDSLQSLAEKIDEPTLPVHPVPLPLPEHFRRQDTQGSVGMGAGAVEDEAGYSGVPAMERGDTLRGLKDPETSGSAESSADDLTAPAAAQPSSPVHHVRTPSRMSRPAGPPLLPRADRSDDNLANQ